MSHLESLRRSAQPLRAAHNALGTERHVSRVTAMSKPVLHALVLESLRSRVLAAPEGRLHIHGTLN